MQFDLWKHFGRLAACLVAGSALAACGSASGAPGIPQNEIAPPAAERAMTRPATFDAWRRSMIRTAFPGRGCFKASYPSLAWSRIQCTVPPPDVPSRQQIGVNKVGNGYDYGTDVAPSYISTAVGSFPAVSGVKRIKTIGSTGSFSGNDSYSLQLNSNHFTTKACKHLKHCVGWQQFLFANPTGSNTSYVYVQYWLLPAPGTSLSKCPPNAGWKFVQNAGCYQNGQQYADVPNQSVSKLDSISLTGIADPSGDKVELASGGDMYGTTLQNAPITDLGKGWQGAEFNIFGDLDDSEVQFNRGSTVSVSIETETGSSDAPACAANAGTTGETNSLTLVSAPAKPSELEFPSVLFTESNAKGRGKASCDALKGSGT
ncbi:MAG TPA: hypothetical protein VMF61_03345 [Candidatus Acidoferrales bacterium]|nr:hypothetical protein [Candidatus Acidoferrales bacterium]